MKLGLFYCPGDGEVSMAISEELMSESLQYVPEKQVLRIGKHRERACVAEVQVSPKVKCRKSKYQTVMS